MKQRILIIEDERLLREAYEIILEGAGYEVMSLDDATGAAEVINTLRPHLLLLDLQLPRTDGMALLEELNIVGLHEPLKIVVFSNIDSASEVEKAQSLGANKYIVKAWASPAGLLKIVRDLLLNKSH